MFKWSCVRQAVAVHVQSKIVVQLFATSLRSFACINKLLHGLVAINDRGFVSGGEIDFRLPTTDADWKYLLKLKPNVDSCLSSPDNWLALQNCWLFFRPPRLHKTPC
jgi:hypothetical protein